MPAYEELDLVASGVNYEIRTHHVNRQDPTKTDYTWPKIRISGPVDWNVLIPEWYEAVESNAPVESLVGNGLCHSISVDKDPDRESADPAIKEFKASFRKALGAGDGSMLAVLKDENIDLFEELKADHIAKLEIKANLLG
jgi:hypothetical protein